ncbi:MAG: DUF1553 domain-containing protein [Acidobacteria bacterium]|nr:DUF1553 domain-containing protein [Acidobacteriota bacterium]
MSFLLALPLLPAGRVDFRREVRPILSDACFHCHGPDKKTRMAGLRLDVKTEAFGARKSGTPIVPGSPDQSLIIKRILHDKPALKMPPASAHKTLTPAQINTLRTWIEQGADWQEHWAFIAPSKPAVPNSSWGNNEIDRFLHARITAAGLTPAAEADRRTLARRASLDITGLPPEPQDVEAFLKDTRPNAYEAYVDKLLSSPHYGEHRARYWLDAARYADTHGLHIDNYREMWHFRDWVINAFNRNLRFDAFTRDQLAGDLLPGGTRDQLIASGFHRNNVTTNEGGVIEDEVAVMYAKDRVDTTSTVFLGLTVGCATCHDHKFDPITQKDFYSMSAFFRNTTQKPLDGNISDTPPVIFLPVSGDEQRWKTIDQDLIQLRGLRGQRADQVAAKAKPELKLPKQYDPVWHLDKIAFSKEGEVKEAPGFNKIQADQPFTVSMWVYYPKPDDNWTLLSQINSKEEDGTKIRGWTIDIQGRQPVLKMVGEFAQPIAARGGNAAKMMPDNWYHIAFTYDGQRRKKDSLELYFNGTRVNHEGKQESSRPALQGSILNNEPLRIGGDGNKRFFKGGSLKDVRIYSRVLSSEEIAVLEMFPRATEGKPVELSRVWSAIKDGESRKLMAKIATTELERKNILRRGAVTHVMVEREDQKPMANILYRGMYDQPRDKVEADVPQVLGGLGSSTQKNRLGLADWLLKAENPLFARVAVNRFWQEIFGTGLVRSSDDFGSQGEAPSHPELLDWLAVDFRENGWDVKRLMRQIVLSAAYRQQAVTTEEKLKKDSDNRLLSRGPRFRMDAEAVRDYALASSGLLVRKVGGPSVRPYQPERIWETVAMDGSDTRFYKQDRGEGLYRRSMYTFWKRSAPPPSMDLFNAPTRENCTVRRERTNTPLQALLTMNDVQFVEAARHLAQRAMETHKNNFDEQLDFLSERLVSRRFEPKERDIIQKSYRDFLRHYDSKPEDARKLIAVGESKANPKLNAPEFAALTMVTNELMNLDEVLNK